MRPEQRSQTLLAITRSKAKMFEYDVPDNYHINITQDPARLFTLSIGILGDLAARSHNGTADTAIVDDLRQSLQFAARFFDAYMQARLNSTLDPYVILLGAASFYLCDLPGSSVVLARRVGAKSPDLGGEGLEDLLRWMLQGDLALGIDRAGVYMRNRLTVFPAFCGSSSSTARAPMISWCCAISSGMQPMIRVLRGNCCSPMLYAPSSERNTEIPVGTRFPNIRGCPVLFD
jgi:hypothetical protein